MRLKGNIMRLMVLFLYSILMLGNWACVKTNPDDLASQASEGKAEDQGDSEKPEAPAAPPAAPPIAPGQPLPPASGPPIPPPAAGPFIPPLAGLPFGGGGHDHGGRNHQRDPELRFCEDNLAPVCVGI